MKYAAHSAGIKPFFHPLDIDFSFTLARTLPIFNRSAMDLLSIFRKPKPVPRVPTPMEARAVEHLTKLTQVEARAMIAHSNRIFESSVVGALAIKDMISIDASAMAEVVSSLEGSNEIKAGILAHAPDALDANKHTAPWMKSLEDSDAIKTLILTNPQGAPRSNDITIDALTSLWIKSFFEFQNFFLHMTDRFAFGHLEESRRGPIMNALARWTLEEALKFLHKDWPVEQVVKVGREAYEHYYQRLLQYAKFEKVSPEKNEEWRGTAIGEFSKIVVNETDKKMYILRISSVIIAVQEGLEKIDMKSFIARVA